MKKLYVDMDGVLAQFNQDATLEELHKEGYYRSLAPINNVVNAINQIVEENNIEVYILSKVLKPEYIKKEKENWLRCFLPNLSKKNYIFCDYEMDKNAVIPDIHNSILLDDFSPNLHEWEKAGGIGIKLYNGINGKHGTWHGYSISANTYCKRLANQIKMIVTFEK